MTRQLVRRGAAQNRNRIDDARARWAIASLSVLAAAASACGGGDDFQVLQGGRSDGGVARTIDAALPGDGGTPIDAAPARKGADLAVAMSATPSPVTAGTALTYTINVVNLGDEDAAGVTLTQRLPQGNVAFQSATGIGWQCTSVGQTVTCTRATLLVGQAPSIAVTVTAPAGGTLETSVAVAATTTDTSDANNSAALSIPVVSPSADLSVSLTGPADPVQGATLPGCQAGCASYTITASNAGPDVATGVSVAIKLPDRGAFFSLIGDGWVCPAPNGTSATCALSATLASGRSASPIVLKWKAPVPGGFSILVSSTVSGAGDDPDVANNAKTVATTILP